MKPLVSIVIPTYNRARDIDRALRSVLAQTYSHWEALIVDNHSSDNTDDVVKSFSDSRIRLLKIHNDGVIAASRNLGIKHARGEYIAFLDSDDWWMPQKLEESLRYLVQGADVVYHDLFLVTRSDQRIFWRKERTRRLKPPVFRDLLVNGNALNNSSVVVRKSIFQKIGGMSEDIALVAMEDYDAWLRAAKFTEKFKRVPRTLGYYWANGGNISSPERTIKFLDAFEERYAKDINDLSPGAGFWWLNYARGEAHYSLRSYAMALKHLKRFHWGQIRPLSMIKALWMILLIKFPYALVKPDRLQG